jgi:hypothetical protein
MTRPTSRRRTSTRRSSRRLLANATAPQSARIAEISPGTKLCLRRVSRYPGGSKDLETIKTVDRIERGPISDGWEEARIWLRGVFHPRTAGGDTSKQRLRPLHAYAHHGVLDTVLDKHAKYEVLGVSR